MRLDAVLTWLESPGREHRLALVLLPFAVVAPLFGALEQLLTPVESLLTSALGALMIMGVTYRRRRPFMALGIAVTGWAVGTIPIPDAPVALPVFAVPTTIALLVIGYTALVEGSAAVRAGGLVLAAVWAVTEIAFVWSLDGIDALSAVFVVLILLLALGLTESSRRRRIELLETHERAVAAERVRELTARTAVDEDRLRLAAELHDGVAGRLSALAVHVTVARRRVTDPTAEEDLRVVGLELSGALAELRRMLGLLRTRAEPDGNQGLGDLPQLVASARAHGADVTVALDPHPDLSPDVDRAAYRVVQEALVNVVRHASPPTARLRIGVLDDCLVVDVDDDGRAAAGPEGLPDAPLGYGLTIMAERMARLGGTLEAGHRPGGGWSVRAQIPLHEAARPESRPVTRTAP